MVQAHDARWLMDRRRKRARAGRDRRPSRALPPRAVRQPARVEGSATNPGSDGLGRSTHGRGRDTTRPRSGPGAELGQVLRDRSTPAAWRPRPAPGPEAFAVRPRAIGRRRRRRGSRRPPRHGACARTTRPGFMPLPPWRPGGSGSLHGMGGVQRQATQTSPNECLPTRPGRRILLSGHPCAVVDRSRSWPSS